MRNCPKVFLTPQLDVSLQESGNLRALTPMRIAPSLVRQVKGSKWHLRSHKTYDRATPEPEPAPVKGRVAETQCWDRGREAV